MNTDVPITHLKKKNITNFLPPLCSPSLSSFLPLPRDNHYSQFYVYLFLVFFYFTRYVYIPK